MEPSPEEIEYTEKLLTPNWAVVEQHFNCTIPTILKEFYQEPESVLQSNYDLETPKEIEGYNRIHIECFSQISDFSIEHFEGFERFLDIASDGGAGIYFIDPKQTDIEVYLFIMDSYDLHPTGLTLIDFLTNQRLEPTDYWDE